MNARGCSRMRQLVLKFCVPLWWEINGRQALRNGSMIIVKTHEALFGVTCRHVLDTYGSDKHTLPDVFCQLGSAPFDPSANVISRSTAWDLATFRIPDDTLIHIGAHTSPLPPGRQRRSRTGDRIMVGGYPENRRSQSAGSRPELLNIDLVTFIAGHRMQANTPYRSPSTPAHGHGLKARAWNRSRSSQGQAADRASGCWARTRTSNWPASSMKATSPMSLC